jgi:two-component system chemotaxis sensor kinase CheA
MSGFDLSQMLPLYLDETDEYIAAMNDALLRLEQSPDDVPALNEVFRYAHSIKGSSTLMGFESVKQLTHNLETIFDQLRGNQRALDLPVLQLAFRCLDALRDFHQGLRATGEGGIDLAGLTAEVVEHLGGPAPTRTVTVAERVAAIVEPEAGPEESTVALRVRFEAGIHLADMKARLVLSRLATAARVIKCEPPADQLEEVEHLRAIIVWLATDAPFEQVRALADVDGVRSIERIDAEPAESAEGPIAGPAPEPERSEPPEAAVGAAEPPAPTEGEGKRTRIAETIRVDIDRLDGLMNLAGELVINKARFVQVTSGLQDLLAASGAQSLAADVQDQFDSLERGLEAMARGAAATSDSERWSAQFRALRENFRGVRAELDRIRESRERIKGLSEAINHLSRVTDGIQKGVLNTRMVPIGPLFARFRRVVRDLSVTSGKEVVLTIEGEKTELDKRMIDELGDPLVHMIRNSVDHGLEPPGEREQAGKPRAGTVRLAAAHRGNSVVITVADDGRGIHAERIRQKAVARRLVSADEARRLSDRDLINLIWHPGFSTAESVTDVSGRGVGMDIVKSRIEGLNGSVDVRTSPGQGTTFLIRLPLTLAIMPSLLVRIYDEVYAIPLDHVDEIVEAPPAVVHRVQGQRTIEIRKKVAGLVELNDVFRWAGGDHPALGRGGSRENGKLTVVVIQDGETALGLVVDELIGIQEVVLKSLEKNFRAVPGLSGASIQGDGRVSLILDVDDIISRATGEGSAAALGAEGAVAARS